MVCLRPQSNLRGGQDGIVGCLKKMTGGQLLFGGGTNKRGRKYRKSFSNIVISSRTLTHCTSCLVTTANLVAQTCGDWAVHLGFHPPTCLTQLEDPIPHPSKLPDLLCLCVPKTVCLARGQGLQKGLYRDSSDVQMRGLEFGLKKPVDAPPPSTAGKLVDIVVFRSAFDAG